MEETGIRINKYLADSGACSRRQADRLIAEGRVSVGGQVAELGTRVLPGQQVTLDGRVLRSQRPKRYIALNKPIGIVCTTDPREKDNIVDFVGGSERLYPIGRLDKDSSGLILMTNDGDIVNKILRAGNNHEKEYRVTLTRSCSDEFLKQMALGVHIPILEQVTRPCRVFRESHDTFRIILTQGLNRQIRRMCQQLGHSVKTLTRLRIMNIKLGALPIGEHRDLTPMELEELMTLLRDSTNAPEQYN